jgi:hypothetical protein
MIPMILPAFMLAALAAAYTPPVEVPPGCRLTHILADGQTVETAGPASQGRGGDGRSVSVTSHSEGSHSASSSVSASSSSSSGRTFASATSDGRKITTTRDERGCRIVVDDRAAGDTP